MLITDVIENYLNNNIPFVSYRLPFTTESVTLVGGSFSAGVKPDQNQTSQFIVAPFDTENVSMQVFAAEIRAQAVHLQVELFERPKRLK